VAGRDDRQKRQRVTSTPRRIALRGHVVSCRLDPRLFSWDEAVIDIADGLVVVENHRGSWSLRLGSIVDRFGDAR